MVDIYLKMNVWDLRLETNETRHLQVTCEMLGLASNLWWNSSEIMRNLRLERKGEKWLLNATTLFNRE